MFSDHGFHHFTHGDLLAELVLNTHMAFQVACALRVKFQTHFVMHRQRTDRHADRFTQVVNLNRIYTFG